MASQNNPVKLAVIHSNYGLEVEFRRKLERLIADMSASVEYWLCAAYKKTPPEMAQDASPAMTLNDVMARLTRKWNRKFSEAAEEMGKYFAVSAKDRTDGSLKAALKKTGFTVKFVMTRQINDIVQASVAQNVSLIKTISKEYLDDVQQMVMRSVSAGRDLGGLRKELQARYGITHRRAALIARTSNNQVTADILKARQEEVGITDAVWIHSHAGKHPRPEHQKWDGQKYKIADGMYSQVSKKYVWPGTDFNCRCQSRSILPHLGNRTV